MINGVEVAMSQVTGAQQAAPLRLRRGCVKADLRQAASLRRRYLYVGALVAVLVLAMSIAAVPVRAQQAPSLNAAQAARAKDLGKRVKCMCGGCNDAAGSCYHSGGAFSGPCPMALDMLKKVDAHVANGESDDAILKSFVQEYGPTVLIEPPKSGFNLTAWVMPILVPLIALIGVWEAVRRWRHRAIVAPVAGPPAPAVSLDLLERVQRETGRDQA